MSDESNVPTEAVDGDAGGTDALADRVTKLESRVTTLEAAAPTATQPNGEPVVVNEGEDLSTTPQNDQVAPVSPGVEPEAPVDPPIVPAPAPEAPLAAGAPEATIAGQAPAPENPTPPADTPAGEPLPAADASEKPLYVIVADDPSYTIPAGYTASGLQTPDGKVLYHYTDDTAGEPGTGAVDGNVGIYADDVVPAA